MKTRSWKEKLDNAEHWIKNMDNTCLPFRKAELEYFGIENMMKRFAFSARFLVLVQEKFKTELAVLVWKDG